MGYILGRDFIYAAILLVRDTYLNAAIWLVQATYRSTY